MKDTSRLLPIGSVVMLQNGTKEIMITGFYAVSQESPNTIYDYNGCLYPEGVISSDKNLLFNHNQIAKLIFTGYRSDNDIEFKKKLGEYINKDNNYE